MPPVPPRRRRARPVADAPIEPLLLRSEDLAKGWLLALLEQAPLDEAAGILAGELTRDGPRICDAALRAVAGDIDLRRLEPGGALRPLAARVGELAGASSPAATSRAVDALQAVLWAALRDELRAPDPDLVSELTERLTVVGELLRGAALEQPAATGAVPLTGVRAAASAAPVAPAPPAPPSPPSAPGIAPVARAVPPVAPEAAPPRVWPEDGARPAGTPGEPLWVGALEEEIRHSAGGPPLSLLLAELEDAERVTAAQTPSDAVDTFSRFAAAVRSAVRRQDILVCESDARAWIIARDTARTGALSLGERIAEAVGGSEGWHGAPLAASVGVAVLGEDGRTTSELIDAAEEARFAAAARGVRVLRAESDDEGYGPRPS